MIKDALNEFAAAEALNTGVPATYLVGDVIDLDPTDSGNIPNIGAGEEMWLVIHVTTTATSGGAATGEFKLVSDSTADLATSPTTHLTSGALAVATLVAGYYILKARLPSGAYEKYLGVTQTTATAAFTAGAINAFLTHDVSDWVSVADGLASGA